MLKTISLFQKLLLLSSFYLITIIQCSVLNETSEAEKEAKNYLDNILEPKITQLCHDRALKEWIFASNLTEFNRANAAAATLEYSKLWKEIHNETRKFDFQNFNDENVKRQLKMLSTLGIAVLKESDFKEYNKLKQKMETIYARAKICDFYDKRKCNLSLEPEITQIFKSSRSEKELQSAWIQWRNVTGNEVKTDYFKMAQHIKKAALLNGFSTVSAYELRAYENPNFEKKIENLWQQLQPFYEEFHAYVRFKLRIFYADQTNITDLIPAHLLGNPWAQTWESIEDILLPYEESNSNMNVTQKMIEKNLTAYDMAKMGVNFFTSIGFPELNPEFWNNSILEKPDDGREMICHASAWDLCNGNDFRIKQCTVITEQDLLTLHHELGHTFYQFSYKDLPKVFRDGANPGFHEAIGDLIALSVQTPNHMRKIGLIDDYGTLDEKYTINFLFKMALTKIAFLPFGYALDKWRWGSFDGSFNENNSNCEWWKLRMDLQGVENPQSGDDYHTGFDPGAKYHVVSNVNYIRYFISMILQFQLHESLCKIAGNQVELHECDIYGNLEAGKRLKSLLQLGSSTPWPLALEELTGTKNLSAKPMLDYFAPLITWLKVQNKLNGEKPGWRKRTDIKCGTQNNTNNSSNFFANYILTILATIINIFTI